MENAKRLNTVTEYYFSTKLAEIAKMRDSGIDVINLGIGNPDLPPPGHVLDELSHVLSQSGIHGYQSYRGIPEFRKAIADWYGRVYSVTLDPQHEVLPLIGSKEGIFHITAAFANPNDVVFVPDPGYPTYPAVAGLLEATTKFYSLKEENNWQPNLDELRKANLDKVKIMWINSPHMPTGVEYKTEVLKKLIQLARKHQFLIVNDNPYSLILSDHPKSIFQVEGAKEVCLELNSLSKSHHMPGWRLGWVSGKKELIDVVLRVKSNMDSGMFKALQLCAVKALQTPMKWHVEQNNVYASRRKRILELMNALNCEANDEGSGMFVWASIPQEYETSESFADFLLERFHIFIPPGTVFGKNGKGFIRTSLCVPEDQITESILRVKQVIL